MKAIGITQTIRKRKTEKIKEISTIRKDMKDAYQETKTYNSSMDHQ